jgi:hypothetical protein
MRIFVAALALTSLIASASLTKTANAALCPRQVPHSAVTGTNNLEPRRANICMEAQWCKSELRTWRCVQLQ